MGDPIDDVESAMGEVFAQLTQNLALNAAKERNAAIDAARFASILSPGGINQLFPALRTKVVQHNASA